MSIGRGCIGTRVVGLGACAREKDETTRLTVFLCCIRFLAVTHDGGALPGTRASRPRRRVASRVLRRASTDDTPTFLSFPPRAQDVPTATQRVQARRFFDALGDLYPCATCRADFRVDSRASPPRVDSRASLSRWVCERHNEVNAKLGKPLVSCELRDLDERWRHSKDCSHRGASQNDADA